MENPVLGSEASHKQIYTRWFQWEHCFIVAASSPDSKTIYENVSPRLVTTLVGWEQRWHTRVTRFKSPENHRHLILMIFFRAIFCSGSKEKEPDFSIEPPVIASSSSVLTTSFGTPTIAGANDNDAQSIWGFMTREYNRSGTEEPLASIRYPSGSWYCAGLEFGQ